MIKKFTGLVFLALFMLPLIASAQSEASKAKVIDVISSEEVQVEGLNISSTRQTITVLFIDGPNTGKQETFMQDKFPVEEGETIFVQETQEGQFQILEKDRTEMILYVFGLFVLLILILNGKQGMKSILGLAISFAVIIFVMLPLVIRGFNPLLISIVIGAAILSAVLFLSHGYNRGSVIALVGTLGAIICAGLLSLGASYWMKLTGLGSDEALNAMIVTKGVINFSDLLLAGIIVGMLGVLDDIAITQVAVVGEIKRANAQLPVREIFVRALRVGKEHVSALVNTLVLAYTGASFPLLILLYSSGVRFDMLISQEIVSAEIVRTLVGSIGLIIAVPLTTYLAAKYLSNDDHVPDAHHGHSHS
jgi:uncharacterized membrane protein